MKVLCGTNGIGAICLKQCNTIWEPLRVLQLRLIALGAPGYRLFLCTSEACPCKPAVCVVQQGFNEKAGPPVVPERDGLNTGLLSHGLKILFFERGDCVKDLFRLDTPKKYFERACFSGFASQNRKNKRVHPFILQAGAADDFWHRPTFKAVRTGLSTLQVPPFRAGKRR